MLFIFLADATAADRKEWTTLADCGYVAHASNDGDSFHVRCGATRDPRYYGMVQVGGRGLDEILVLEEHAKQKRRGLWAAAPQPKK